MHGAADPAPSRPAFGPIGGPGCGRPNFAAAVPDGGYAWWYMDALSDDHRHGITIIGFVGSVFSPWYAWARRRGPTAAENHCALNILLSGPGGRRWAMTERGARAVTRDDTTLRVGPSAMHWDGASLQVTIDEITCPVPSRLRGSVRLTPTGIGREIVSLDAAGGQCWSPIAPTARVEVAMSQPARAWSGAAYFDMNWGARPLEADFAEWYWCRTPVEGGTAILYDVTRRDGSRSCTALHYTADGGCAGFDPPPEFSLPPGLWRLKRATRTDAGTQARIVETLDDTPFYVRSVVQSQLLGQPVTAIHEALSLDRFDTHWMRLMLPFKAPRSPFARVRG